MPYLHNIDVDGGWIPKPPCGARVMSELFVGKRKDRTFTNASEGANFNIELFDVTSQKMWTFFYRQNEPGDDAGDFVDFVTDTFTLSIHIPEQRMLLRRHRQL